MKPMVIGFRPITDADREFLYQVYSSTRNEEMAMTGWGQADIENFLRMQFDLQHTQYTQSYPDASFDIILTDNVQVGRIYADRRNNRITVIEISLLPEFRLMGIGGAIMRKFIEEADEKKLSINLHVECNNPVLPFYKTLGFQVIETLGIYHHMERVMNRRYDSLGLEKSFILTD